MADLRRSTRRTCTIFTLGVSAWINVVLLHGSIAAADTSKPLEPRQMERVLAFAEANDPVFLTHAGDGSGRLFIVERPGVIKAVDPIQSTVSLFLDHQGTVNKSPGEGGLLGLAFHPDFAANGRVFLSYTYGNLFSRVTEMQLADDGRSLDPTTERVLLEVSQPAGNHNGGMITFATDGFLYVGLGDGGASNDRFLNGQDPTTLLGTILRLDVNGKSPGLEYAIPPDNPFVGNADGWREEIWAWGLRNPWRFSFDRLTGELWAGDVGQDRREEIDIIRRGGNYGWNVMEGFECFRSSNCQTEGLLPPVLQYSRSAGVSVTGGYVYRGRQLGDLYGAYIYGDFGSGHIWAIRHDGTAIVDSIRLATSPSNITSFGEDEEGELYVVGYDGWIYRFLPLEGEEPIVTAVLDRSEMAGTEPARAELDQNYPNPFNPTTTIRYTISAASPVTLAVFDILGRHVRTLVDAKHPSGSHTTTWDATDQAGRAVAPGVYFYRLQTATTSATRRLLLLR